MIKFNKPTNLNGDELLAELKEGGINIVEIPHVDSNGDLWLKIDTKDEAKTKAIVHAHNGTTVAPVLELRQAVLAKLGLTAEEAAALLS